MIKRLSARNFRYKDNLALKRRRRFIFKMFILAILLLATVAAAVYFLFFSGYLLISNLSVRGLNEPNSNLVESKVKSIMLEKKFYLPLSRNILFFNPDKYLAILSSEFPFLILESVEKKLPRSITINAKEREPIGIWCFNISDKCLYFDSNNATWEASIKSSGFLIVLIDDMRDNPPEEIIEDIYFDPVNKISNSLKEIKIAVKKIIIPQNSFNEFWAETERGYKIMFNIGTNLDNQVQALNLFLEEKKDDPEFNPEYIDLRIEGRIYTK